MDRGAAVPLTEEIKQVLERVKRVPGLAARLPDSAHLIHDVRLDSLEMMELMLELESSLALTIDFERLDFSALESIATLSEVIATMRRHDA
jgi:acyl carrier protein